MSGITVNENVTLTIAAGTIVKFANNTHLRVYGQLIANGTSGDKIKFMSIDPNASAGAWSRIDIGQNFDPPFAASSISYAIIEDAVFGVIGRYSDGLTLQNSTFRNNLFGPYAYVSDMVIDNNSIEGTGKYGIYSYNSSSTISDNTIDGFRMSPGYGVYINQGSPKLKRNTITNNLLDGVRTTGSGYPTLISNSTLNINNSITDNSRSGLYASNGSFPNAGKDSRQPGSNCFTYNSSYEIQNLNSSWTLRAENNAWGKIPSSSDFNGVVDYSPYLSEPSWGCGIPMVYFENLYEQLFELFPFAINKAYAIQVVDDTTGSALSLSGYEKFLSGDYKGAISIFKDVIRSYPNSPASEFSLTMIREAFLKDNKKTDHRNYIGIVASSGKRSKASRFAMRNLVSAYQRDGKIDEAVAIAEEILSTDPTDEESMDILFQLGMINMFSNEDSSKAIEYFRQIVTDFPDDDIAQVAADHIELLNGGGLGKGAFGDKSSDENKPSKYFLSDNYPNPFNPETKIEFALPNAGFTRLIIYDLRGREVTRLIDKELNAGVHTISWNASGFASGLYFYSLQSGNFIQTKKMMLLK